MSVPSFTGRVPVHSVSRAATIAIALVALLGAQFVIASAIGGCAAPPGGPTAESDELRLTVIGIAETDIGMEARLELTDRRPWWRADGRMPVGAFSLETDVCPFDSSGLHSGDADPTHLSPGETKRLDVLFPDAEGHPLFLTYRTQGPHGQSLDVDVSTLPLRGAWRQASQGGG